ncbi:hypothetical protein SLEP1_g49251 [Rubroshorea leprosula]|uniref:Cysteine-rich receptor-like protein kinase 29 n=1 Tax=Rubroshorea leprosula TaxID=152421 RepID=A0AAV5LXH5_9ROSI|nr:hypothetical protein SLEP1_g49251 [Rubroshorea leprosula]
MGSSRLFLILFSSVFLTNLCSAADLFFLSSCPSSEGNFTANSPYGSNLNGLFSQLISDEVFNYGFYNMSVGQSPDQRLCPNNKEAIGWSENCTLHYSSQQLFGVMETDPKASPVLVSGTNATDLNAFNQALSSLLNNLSNRAAAGGSLRKYAADNTTSPDVFGKIYALVQCSPDLSQEDCSNCLAKAIDRVSNCGGNTGCRIQQPSCNLRYETYPFFQAVDDIPQPSSPPPPTEGKGNDTTRRTIIISVVASVVGVLLLVLCIWIILRLRKPKETVETADEMIKAESLQYDFATVKAATNNFSDENKLGQGGFGAVYRGRLPDGQHVAIKRLSSGSGQGDTEFKNEVLLVAKLQHRNLVRLLGFCLEGDERLLIYEFLPNTSLDHFIFDSIKCTQLDWEMRYKIIGGIARGLLYLHEDSRLRIIHCDLKASNILLDEDMNSKIADFGMARLFVRDETQGNTSRIVGTYGYMAPEYAMHGQFSVKSDVYSFGVLLLEIVSSQKNNCFRNGENVEDLVSYAWKNWREGTGINLIDPTLKNGSRTEMMRCIHIGLLCVQENVVDRPTMATVVLMLNSNSTTLPMPSQPAFFMHSNIESDLSSSNGYNSWVSQSKNLKEENLPLTKNDVSITKLYPR